MRFIGIIYLIFSVFSLSAIACKTQLKFAAISDFNGSLGSLKYYSHSKAIKSIHQHDPSLIIGVGDFVSGEDYRKKFSDSHFPKMWRNFDKKILQPITQYGRIPFLPTAGNHDAPHGKKMRRERRAYKRFWNGKNIKGITKHDFSNYPMYYSYFKKDVFFVVLDDVKSGSLNDGTNQKRWLKRIGRESQVRMAKARIVYGHVPLYPVLDKGKHSRGSKKYQAVLKKEQVGGKYGSQGLAQLLLDLNFDLAIFAHSHAYYPGKMIHKGTGKSLKILSMPCSGPGQRYLHGQSKRSKRGFSVIKICRNGDVELDMFTNSGNRVSKSSLPKRIPISDKKVRYVRAN